MLSKLSLLNSISVLVFLLMLRTSYIGCRTRKWFFRVKTTSLDFLFYARSTYDTNGKFPYLISPMLKKLFEYVDIAISFGALHKKEVSFIVIGFLLLL